MTQEQTTQSAELTASDWGWTDSDGTYITQPPAPQQTEG
jgi:hypothetical protein